MRKEFLVIALLMLCLSRVLGLSLAQAATFDVNMGKTAPPCGAAVGSDIGFVDCTTNTGGYLQIAMTNINTGDTVRWTNITGPASPHTTTSEVALTGGPIAACATGDNWDSGVANSFIFGFVYTHQFNTPGTCTYFCIIHPAVMQGQVNVIAAATTTTTTTSTTTTTTTSTTSTTTTVKENCNDQNKGQGKDKGKGHPKGKCKGPGKDK